jgi:carbon-monoxide dehydrogenase medium subunit
MRPFSFHQPATLGEVFSLLDEHGDEAHLIAGGTAMVLLMKQRLVQPEHVVSLRRVPGLSEVVVRPDGGLEIGAMVTHRDAETSPEVARYNASLAEAFGHVATIRIRNIATVGGNVVHADPYQDPPPMLMALGGEAVLASQEGERTIPLDEFFLDYFETAMNEGEVLTSIRLPAQPAGVRSHYVKFLPRTADDYPTVAVATVLRLDGDDRVEDVRIALGGAGPVTIRARDAESALRGQTLTPERMREAAGLAREASDPLDDVRGSADYKKDMVAVWVRRSLERLAQSPNQPNGRVH